MEYACGTGNCVVELNSIYVLGTLVYVFLLRNDLHIQRYLMCLVTCD